MIKKQQMLSSLDSLISDGNTLFEKFARDLITWTPDFVAWLKACESTLEAIYGSKSDALQSFKYIYFIPPHTETFANDTERSRAQLIWFDSGLRYALQTLVGFRYSLDRLLPEEEQSRPNPFVFISHGGTDRLHVDAVSELLKTVGLSPVVVEDLPNLNMSVNDKVHHYMGLCGSAIILATLDDENPDTRHTRQNISHEIGLLQNLPNVGGRVVYLKEKLVELPSNFAEKSWIPFERHSIEKIFVPILKELRAFGLVGW
ncbi:MAG: nucleotide-binding protein [Thermodesulfovibrionales bacterium]|nr:nucleotide-binding protein [Thermodesulfovibrionales bacterium]